MLLKFRQGLVQLQTPAFFSITLPYVDLLANTTHTVIAFADGDKDYLHTEQQSVSRAWGPFTTSQTRWLYWDLNTRTAARTFGSTLLEPIISAQAPSSPANDQHWFSTTANSMFVWNGSSWVKRIRAFAVKLNNGRVPVSVSTNSPSYIGTQVGNNDQVYAGHIIFDADSGTAIRDQAGQFITTEDRLAVDASSSSIKLAGIVVEGEAQQNMASHTIVVFSSFGKIIHANQFTAGQTQQFGIIETSATVGQNVVVTTHGVVTSPDWDWTAAGINALLYCNEYGTIVTAPIIPNQSPVGVVLDRRTIQLGSPVVSSGAGSSTGGGGGTTVSLASVTVAGITKLSVAPDDENAPIAVGTNDPRLTDARAPAIHTHGIGDVVNLQPQLDSKVSTTDPRLSNARAPTSHNHTIAQILTLQPQLDNKVSIDDIRLSNARPPTSHNHTIGQILNLQTTLDSKIAEGDGRLSDPRTPLAHLHSISQVLNLQTTLDEKVSTTGGVLTGLLTLSGAPVNANHAATKAYVDAQVAGGGSGGGTTGPGGVGLNIDFGTILIPSLSLDFGTVA